MFVQTPSTTKLRNKIVEPEMPFYCFDVLIYYLNGKADETPEPKFEDSEYPLFVTWHHWPQQKLRGCIGTFTPIRLHSGIKEYAIISSQHDSRFEPISKDEVEHLTVTVSLLTNFEKINPDPLNWVVGKHGLRIEITDSNNQIRTATYLPEVAEEQRWSKSKTIDELIKKAGISCPTIAQRNSMSIERYQSERCVVNYSCYKEWADNRAGNPHVNNDKSHKLMNPSTH